MNFDLTQGFMRLALRTANVVRRKYCSDGLSDYEHPIEIISCTTNGSDGVITNVRLKAWCRDYRIRTFMFFEDSLNSGDDPILIRTEKIKVTFVGYMPRLKEEFDFSSDEPCAEPVS